MESHPFPRPPRGAEGSSDKRKEPIRRPLRLPVGLAPFLEPRHWNTIEDSITC